MDLTEFLKVLFEKPKEWKNVSRADKQRFFFMTQRMLSAAYPAQAQSFNAVGVNQADVMDYWQTQLTKIYKRRPDWLWGWAAKKKKDDKKSRVPSEEAVSGYLDRVGMSRRDLADAVELFGADKAYEPIFRYQRTLEEHNS
jgi:hypothetical protein